MASAGNVSRLSKCTPMESAAEYMANTNQRSASASLGKLYHLSTAHSVMAVKNVDMALATEKAIQAFKPQIALLIGIAGGVKDVGIGDLLIAKKAYGYESGKEDVDGYRF